MRITAEETKYYVYGLTGLMSEFSTTDTGVTAAAPEDQLTYVLSEHNGTGAALADQSGAPVENNRVYPFGELMASDPNPANDEKYTTYHRDPTTDFDYAMARWYANREGRFMSPDPGHVGADLSNPQIWNAYNYVDNDPLNYVDLDSRQKGVPPTVPNPVPPGAGPRGGGGHRSGEVSSGANSCRAIASRGTMSNGFVVAAGTAAVADGPVPIGDILGLGILAIGVGLMQQTQTVCTTTSFVVPTAFYASENEGKTVKEILKGKKGSIKSKRLPSAVLIQAGEM